MEHGDNGDPGHDVGSTAPTSPTIRAGMSHLGYPAGVSETNFVMVDLRRDATGFRDACRARGVLIGRAFPPLVTFARVSIGTLDEMHRAGEVFRSALARA